MCALQSTYLFQKMKNLEVFEIILKVNYKKLVLLQIPFNRLFWFKKCKPSLKAASFSPNIFWRYLFFVCALIKDYLFRKIQNFAVLCYFWKRLSWLKKWKLPLKAASFSKVYLEETFFFVCAFPYNLLKSNKRPTSPHTSTILIPVLEQQFSRTGLTECIIHELGWVPRAIWKIEKKRKHPISSINHMIKATLHTNSFLFPRHG